MIVRINGIPDHVCSPNNNCIDFTSGMNEVLAYISDSYGSVENAKQTIIHGANLYVDTWVDVYHKAESISHHLVKFLGGG